MNKWVYNKDRHLRLECKTPQQPDSVLRESYGVKTYGNTEGDVDLDREHLGKRVSKRPSSVVNVAAISTATPQANKKKRGGRGGHLTDKKSRLTAAQKRKAAAAETIAADSDDSGEVRVVAARVRVAKVEQQSTLEHEELCKLRRENAALLLQQHNDATAAASPPQEAVVDAHMFPPVLPNTIQLSTLSHAPSESLPTRPPVPSGDSSGGIPSNEALCNLMFMTGCNFQKVHTLEEELYAARQINREHQRAADAQKFKDALSHMFR